MKFLVISEFGELLDLAIHLKEEGNEVLFHVPDSEYKKIGEGIVEKTDDSFIHMGKGYIWVFDGCTRGKRQDWLRSKGELVFGGTEKSDELENNRQMGQKLFKAAGFHQPISKTFKDFPSAIEFIKNNSDKKWILKQEGDAPKSLNHIGKFDGGEDMLFHMDELSKKWNEAEFGPVHFQLMEIVEGTEMAASAWFNGKDWMRNKQGKVVGFLNFEEKKEFTDGLGETTGEMGTTFIGVTEDNALFKDIMLRPKIKQVLAAINYRGVFDINCIKTKDGMVALEPTCRFGIPATSYEFMEGLKSNTGQLIADVAAGKSTPVEIHPGVGMVMVIAAKPFPLEGEFEANQTSLGEKLWILNKGKPIKEFTSEQRKHICLENFEKKDGDYRVATKSGYLFTVTGKGKTIKEVRESLIQYIKDNVYISGMKYRNDIGKRVEDATGTSTSSKIEKYILNKIGDEKNRLQKEYEDMMKQQDNEMKKIKEVLKKEIYG